MENKDCYSDEKQSMGGFKKPSELQKVQKQEEKAQTPIAEMPVSTGKTKQISQPQTKWKVFLGIVLLAVVIAIVLILWPAPVFETDNPLTEETEKYNENGFAVNNMTLRKLPLDSSAKWDTVFFRAEFEENMNELFPVLKPETISQSAMYNCDVVLELKFEQKTEQNELLDIVCALTGPEHFSASITEQIVLDEVKGVLHIKVNDPKFGADVWRTGIYILTVKLNGKTAYVANLHVVDDSELY